MRLTATSCIFAYSGRVPTTDCIFDTGLLGGSAPCQSQSQTVPKEPSPKALTGVNERTEAVRESEGLSHDRVETERVRKRNEQLCAFPYRTPVGVMLNEGIASAVNGSFGAGMLVGR
jgi:hypothetical protein